MEAREPDWAYVTRPLCHAGYDLVPGWGNPALVVLPVLAAACLAYAVRLAVIRPAGGRAGRSAVPGAGLSGGRVGESQAHQHRCQAAGIRSGAVSCQRPCQHGNSPVSARSAMVDAMSSSAIAASGLRMLGELPGALLNAP